MSNVSIHSAMEEIKRTAVIYGNYSSLFVVKHMRKWSGGPFLSFVSIGVI